ncbi:MAG: ABC transporter ATP-binding protein [Acidobacteria bacterium]|nr:ABC transporter ATP-binding protein [Acidobacteriota bacterium]
MQPERVGVRTSELTKSYASGQATLTVLDQLSLVIEPGERVALVGESGAGKTTLLYLLGGLDRPTKGSIHYGSTDISQLGGDGLAEFRNRYLGFVWQQWSLLGEFSALENVAMPLRIRGEKPQTAARLAEERLDEVGLSARLHHRAGELSGGEQQRVAIARALASGPRVLLADEPTGNLDARTGERIMSLLVEMQERHQLTSVIVTHNPEVAGRCDRVVALKDGRLTTATMESKSYV